MGLTLTTRGNALRARNRSPTGRVFKQASLRSPASFRVFLFTAFVFVFFSFVVVTVIIIVHAAREPTSGAGRFTLTTTTRDVGLRVRNSLCTARSSQFAVYTQVATKK